MTPSIDTLLDLAQVNLRLHKDAVRSGDKFGACRALSRAMDLLEQVEEMEGDAIEADFAAFAAA